MTEQDQGHTEHPANSQSPSAPPPPDSTEELVEEELAPEQDSRAMEVLAMAMPWVLSLLFHVGIFLVMMFFVFAFGAEEPEEISVSDASVLTAIPNMSADRQQTKSSEKSESSREAPSPSEQIARDPGKTARPLAIQGQGAQGGASAEFKTAGGANVDFAGSGAVGYNIVYVIDRSGSMIDTFDFVRKEMYASIGRLDKDQYFHVVLFATGAPLEPKSRRLVPADRRNQRGVVDFLRDVNAHGDTDPLPALERAFAVLADNRRPKAKQSKLIFLLTDADFRDPDRILAQIKQWNDAYRSKGEGIVHVNTLLYHRELPSAAKAMKQIASENGGSYQFVPSPN